jgi:hypothetical protein
MRGMIGFSGRPGFLVGLVFFALGCGARAGVEIDRSAPQPRPTPRPEECNGLDDDLDGLFATGVLDAGLPEGGMRGCPDGGRLRGDGGTGCDADLRVDEDFRDALGRYVHDEHCGRCGFACHADRIEHAIEAGCEVVEGVPTCVARRCEPGWVPSRTGRCVPVWDRLCLVCGDDGDCGDFEGALCVERLGEQRCTIDCALGCPEGYVCIDGVCLPPSGSCFCEKGEQFTLACSRVGPEGERCPGHARCVDGVLSECEAAAEVCDEADNDCDGRIDEGFRDARGAYALDIHHCGRCGVDCTMSAIPEDDLICGGDPFAPACVLHCPDADDGVMPGDRIDGDRRIETGCECVVTSLEDGPGPVGASGSMLDVNCDGADGIVVRSIYVAPDGDDSAPGSPTRPMRTIDAALARAARSLSGDSPRPHVFVAVGVYTETLHVPDGVQLHGGYRRDFLALDPAGFRVEVRAPSDTTTPGGAALDIRGAGIRETVVEWIEVRGVDADAEGEAAFGAYLLDPGPRLVLRDLEVRAGVPGSGRAGRNGEAGQNAMEPPSPGEPPRGAVEDASHDCLAGDPRNVVRGGRGGRNVCAGIETHGGDGGSPSCPHFAMFQPSGQPGRSVGAASGGAGGAGGQDSQGPILRSHGSCSSDVCCGLADFTVPTDFMGPQPGRPGMDGFPGSPGRSCTDPLGHFEGDRWVGEEATAGTAGQPGSGGGGGGAGGGTEMNWYDGVCEFVDGLGGGGGGGGAGGCGGAPGSPGTSGGPSVAVLVRYTGSPGAGTPTIRRAVLAPSDGGRGGDGGAGGEGGAGGSGALGGALPREARIIPTLAGPFPGGRGGRGGDGGAGGGGGAGCGGGSIGIWVTGTSIDRGTIDLWRRENTFRLGRGGIGGRGGGGAFPAPDGADGGSFDVVVR